MTDRGTIDLHDINESEPAYSVLYYDQLKLRERASQTIEFIITREIMRD